MDINKYFETKKELYGTSLKFEFGKWEGYGVRFYNMEDAEKWLNTEEYDFRERELCSKTAAIKAGGKENIIDYKDLECPRI